MGLDLFVCIHSVVEIHVDYFVQKRDVNGKLRLSSLQKMTVVIRMLAYEITVDLMDEYVRIGKHRMGEYEKNLLRRLCQFFLMIT